MTKYHHGHSAEAVELLRVHLLEDRHPGYWLPGHRHPGHRHPGHRLPQPGRLCHWHRRLNWVPGGTNEECLPHEALDRLEWNHQPHPRDLHYPEGSHQPPQHVANNFEESPSLSKESVPLLESHDILRYLFKLTTK